MPDKLASVTQVARALPLATFRLFSATLNVCTGGSLYEPFSARVGRNVYCHERPRWLWCGIERVLNLVFRADPDHCVASFFRASRRKSQYRRTIAWIFSPI